MANSADTGFGATITFGNGGTARVRGLRLAELSAASLIAAYAARVPAPEPIEVHDMDAERFSGRRIRQIVYGGDEQRVEPLPPPNNLTLTDWQVRLLDLTAERIGILSSLISPLPFDRPKRPKKPTRIKLELGEEYRILTFSYRLMRIPSTPFDIVGNYVMFTFVYGGLASDAKQPVDFLREYEIEHNGHTCVLECRDRRHQHGLEVSVMFRVKEVLPSQKYLWEEFAC